MSDEMHDLSLQETPAGVPENDPLRAPTLDAEGTALTEDQEQDRLYYKTSGIPGTGRGIWAKWNFHEGDLIVEFLGKRYDDWTKTYSNCKYAVEITTETGAFAYIDGWGVGLFRCGLFRLSFPLSAARRRCQDCQ